MDLCKASDSIHDFVQPSHKPYAIPNFANGEEGALNIRAGPASRIMPDRQTLVRRPKNRFDGNHKTWQAN